MTEDGFVYVVVREDISSLASHSNVTSFISEDDAIIYTEELNVHSSKGVRYYVETLVLNKGA